MKNIIKFSAAIAFQLMCTHFACAQTSMKDVPLAEASVAIKPVITPTYGKEVTVNIKNTAGVPVYIYSGPKEGLRDLKVRELGGASLNKLYLHENEIVCLVSHENKLGACTIIKPGVTNVEVNTTASNLTNK